MKKALHISHIGWYYAGPSKQIHPHKKTDCPLSSQVHLIVSTVYSSLPRIEPLVPPSRPTAVTLTGVVSVMPLDEAQDMGVGGEGLSTLGSVFSTGVSCLTLIMCMEVVRFSYVCVHHLSPNTQIS